MNIYRIDINTAGTEGSRRKNIGYASETNEYKALRSFRFELLKQQDYWQTQQGQDEWLYTAGNAVNCLIYATKL